MQQLDLVSDCLAICRDHLDVQLHTGFLPDQQARQLLSHLIKSTPWQQPRVKVWGKWHLTPRLVAFYGDPERHYAYSENPHTAQSWTTELTGLKQLIEKAHAQRYNAVLLNYYRDGRDTIGWHADDEAELGERPTIASLSLGAARDIHFRSRSGDHPPIRLNLPSGSLLIMRGDTQHYWQHHLPRRARCTEPRINLTFRYIHT